MTGFPRIRAGSRPLFFLLAALACHLAFLAAAGGAFANPLPKVLIIHTYHQGATRTDGLSRGVAKGLAAGGSRASSMSVYLEADRLGSSPDYPRYLQSLENTLTVMTAATLPKVVITSDWAALKYWNSLRGRLAPNVPVVYCGIGSPPPDWALESPLAFGVVETLSLKETIEAAMGLCPKADKLLVLESSAPYFGVTRRRLDLVLPEFQGRLAVTRHTDQDILSVERALRKLDKSWIVLAVGRSELDGVPLDTVTAARRVSSASPVPVFGPWRAWVGHGSVGGKVISSENQGEKAGRIALGIVNGESPGSFPKLQEDAGEFLFDYAALERFGLDESLLPQGSVILNKPVSFYHGNKHLVWTYGLITVLLLVVSVSLGLHVVQHRRGRHQLASQVNFVESLMEAMPTPVFYKDAQGVYLGCNKAMEASFGLKREQLVGRTVYDLYPREEADVYKQRDDALLAAGGVQFYEYEKITGKGPRQIRFHKAVYRDAEGAVAGLVGVIADITDLRNAEMEVEKTRDYLQAIIESSPSALFCVNCGGVVTHANATARDRWGARPGDHFEQAASRLGPVMDHLRQAIAEGKPRRLPRRTSMEEGALKAWDIMVYPMKVAGQDEAVVVVEDSTERHRMEEVLVQSEKMMSVGGLAAGMAHEINNPLGGIMQSAQVVLNRMRVDLPANVKAAAQAGAAMETIRNYLELRDIPSLLDDLRTSANRAAGIVSNMLEFSKRNASAWLPESVNSMLEKALELCLQDYNLADNYDFKHIAIVKDYDPDDPHVPCSVQQIQQVAFNLLRNAAQAMAAAGTPNPTITLVTRRTVGRVVIEVRDNGPGMDEAVRRKVFEPFFTTKSPGMGTGLGLSVTYFIVKENHGGDIEVESEPGKGARFVVSLPLNKFQQG